MFDFRLFPAEPGDILHKDRFRQVEAAIVFRRGECYRCGFVGFYKLQVHQVRRNPEILTAEGEEVRQDHIEIWKTIPRFAEIPQTVKCKRCREVLGFSTSCIF